MALLERQSRPTDEIPTASMADIAFLLLVFFLTTTVFVEEKGLPIVLPEAEADTPVPPENTIHFLVQENGTVVVRRGDSTAEQVVTPDDVESIMRQEIAANPNVIAAVKTAPDAPYRYMVNVLDNLQRATAQRISLQLWDK